MKILMTSDTFLPSLGGAEIHVKEMASNLVALGHEVILVTNEPAESTGQFPFRVVRIAWSRANIFKMWKILWREASGVDVIHAHYSYRLASIAMLVARLRGKSSIVILHGTGTLDEPKSRFPYKQAHALYRFLSLNLATRVISTSEDLAIVAREHMWRKGNLKVIFNGVDTETFHPGIAVPKELKDKYRGKKVILTVRRLVPKNGIQFMIESMPLVVKQVADVKYVVIGTGRMEEYLKQRVRELSISEYVDFLGAVPNTSVSGYLRLADVVVFPSTAESSSIACAEALAMGCPVVASRVGGLVELLGAHEERGDLVRLVDWQGSNYAAPVQLPSARYQDLATKIFEVISRSDDTKVREGVRYAQEELDWAQITRKTIAEYSHHG